MTGMSWSPAIDISQAGVCSIFEMRSFFITTTSSSLWLLSWDALRRRRSAGVESTSRLSSPPMARGLPRDILEWPDGQFSVRIDRSPLHQKCHKTVLSDRCRSKGKRTHDNSKDGVTSSCARQTRSATIDSGRESTALRLTHVAGIAGEKGEKQVQRVERKFQSQPDR